MLNDTPPTPKKFLTNQGENTLSKRLEKILPLTHDFDCLVGYFFISGFFRLYPALEAAKKVRILIGLKNEQVVHGLIQIAQNQPNDSTPSTTEVKGTFGGMLKKELVQADDSLAIETGIHKFIEWIRSGKLEVKLPRSKHPCQGVHHDPGTSVGGRESRIRHHRFQQSFTQRIGGKSGVQCLASRTRGTRLRAAPFQ